MNLKKERNKKKTSVVEVTLWLIVAHIATI